MIYNVLVYLRNFFEAESKTGDFEVRNGQIALDFVKPQQFFRVEGSVFSDGVYRYPASSLIDESFSGTVTALAVPPALVDLINEISEWVADPKNAQSPFESESFGDYSYSRLPDDSWQAVFGKRLRAWRKI